MVYIRIVYEYLLINKYVSVVCFVLTIGIMSVTVVNIITVLLVVLHCQRNAAIQRGLALKCVSMVVMMHINHFF